MTKETKYSIPFVYKFIVSIIIFAIMFIIAMSFGAESISIKEVWLAVTTRSVGDKINIIREIRLPREIAAIFVGAGLSVSGSIMQGMTRNPLADPGLLGLTSGANAALAIAIAFIPALNYFGIMVACFIGATIGAVMVFGIGTVKRGGFSPFRIVLAGAAVTAFLSAIAEGIGIYFKISKDVSMWTAGGIMGTSWNQLQIIIPFISIAILVSIVLSRQLTVLSLSEEVAIGLGQRTIQIKVILFIVIIILTGAAVALAGNMAFVGLIVPHVARRIVGKDYRFIIPMSAIVGGTFIILADTIARNINAPYETPLVSVVAILGLPFFMLIMAKGGKEFS